MELFGKIINSPNKEYIDTLFGNGANSREVSNRLLEKGEKISHTYLAKYAKAYDLDLDSEQTEDNTPNTGIANEAIKMKMEDVVDLIGKEIKVQSMTLIEGRKAGTITEKTINTSGKLLKTLKYALDMSGAYIELGDRYENKKHRQKYEEIRQIEKIYGRWTDKIRLFHMRNSDRELSKEDSDELIRLVKEEQAKIAEIEARYSNA